MAKTKKQPITIGDFYKMLVLAKWASGVFNRMSFEALERQEVGSSVRDSTGHV